MSEETDFLRELSDIGAISLEVAAFLLVSAHSVADSDVHGFLCEALPDQIGRDDVDVIWTSECKPISERLSALEDLARDTGVFDIPELLANDAEYRDLATREAEYALKLVIRNSDYLLADGFDLPTCLIDGAILKGREELNEHIRRERSAMCHAIAAVD